MLDFRWIVRCSGAVFITYWLGAPAFRLVGSSLCRSIHVPDSVVLQRLRIRSRVALRLNGGGCSACLHCSDSLESLITSVLTNDTKRKKSRGFMNLCRQSAYVRVRQIPLPESGDANYLVSNYAFSNTRMVCDSCAILRWLLWHDVCRCRRKLPCILCRSAEKC